MAKGTPLNFVHLLERMSEPLGFGVRGNVSGDRGRMIYFYYSDDKMMNEMVASKTMQQTMRMIQSRMEQVQSVQKIPVPAMPHDMPDLTLINKLCPKIGNFNYFLPAHKKAFAILKTILMKPSNTDTLFQMACACRDHPMINSQLFVFALCSTLVSRRDTRHIRIPGHYEIMPANYCDADVVRQANKMAHMPEIPNARNAPTQHVVMVDRNITGKGSDPEQKLWYFREDILVNSHHFHWHVVFPTCSPKDPKAPGYRDRRGELFFYMHHSMIARYDAERLCNGLPRVRKFNFSDMMLEEGYFGKLTSENSNQQWGTRQAFTRLTDIYRAREEGLEIRVEELQRWRDRILETIDLGYVVTKDPKTGKDGRVLLDETNGIDILGDIVEASATLTPHAQYYGEIGFHNMGHVLIAFSHDPAAKFKEKAGVMGDVSSAMRDPAFYRWHKYIDNIFDLYKKTLPPYPLKKKPEDKTKWDLVWDGVEITKFYVMSQNNRQPNKLQTFWDMKNVDLSRGLDFRRDSTTGLKKTPVTGRFTHLNHDPFDYFIKINNKTKKQALATIRIFMAPQTDESGETYPLTEQRLQFFEMDKVARTLEPGMNDIRISSKDSSVTLRDENGSSFKRIEELYREAKGNPDVVNESQCSCGWPQHLLLPRGTPGTGTAYDLFVIITDGQQDMAEVNRYTGCKSAFSFCGVLDKKYPDARPMGFPFDRRPFEIKNPQMADIYEPCLYTDFVPVATIGDYVAQIKNSALAKVTISHENKMSGDKVMMMGEQVMSPDGRCVEMKDFYESMGGQGNNNENNGTWGNQQNRPRPPSNQEYDYDQWGGVGSGRRRQGRDEDWEHLDNDWNDY